MGYFTDINVMEQRKRERQEQVWQMREVREEFLAQALPETIDLIREFAEKAPSMAAHRFTLIPTHRRRFSFFEGGTSYKPVIEMPEVMMVRFGVDLGSVVTDTVYWNEVYIDRSGRFHCSERTVVIHGDDKQMMCSFYKGVLYERNLAGAMVEAYLQSTLSPDDPSTAEALDVHGFIESIVKRLEVYLIDEE